MKPRFRRLVSNALPTLIIVPAFSTVAPAAVLNVSSPGSIEIASGYNQPDSIRANGSSGPSPQLTVTIAKTATLTGDSSFEDGIRVTTSGYTIHNFGSLSTSLRDGIRISADGATVNNSGSIQGVNSGVNAQAGLTLFNFFVPAPETKQTTANSAAVLVKGTLASIRATDGPAIKAGNGAQITNEASITSTSGNGITVGNQAKIDNNSTYEETSSTYYSGKISGSQNGISAGTLLNLTNRYQATIQGDDGDGVNAKATATIWNDGTISGSDDGIDVDTPSQTEPLNQIDSTDVNSLEPAPATVITNYGTITGENGDGINGSSMVEQIVNHGQITGANNAINLAEGDDSITLHSGSSITGDIIGGRGTDTLTFEGGATRTRDWAENVVNGSVFGIETITKNGLGTATIGSATPSTVTYSQNAYGEDFMPYPPRETVEANEIFINQGALYINGHVERTSSSEGNWNTSIYASGGEIGGTNGFAGAPNTPLETRIGDSPAGWQANIFISNGGGISAGSEPNYPTSNEYYADKTSASIPIPPIPVQPSAIGLLRIDGSVTHRFGKPDRDSEGSYPYEPSPTYIRVDIAPGTEILEGINSDLIVQTGKNSIYDMSGAEVWIAPTNQSQDLTNGSYTIIDSQQNIVGFDPETTKIGVIVQNQPSQMNEGLVRGSEMELPESYVSYDTVLGNYFAKLSLANPEPGDPTAVRSLSGIEGIDLSGIQEGTDLVLTIDYNFSELPGLTENQSAFGQALDQFIGAPASFEDEALTELIDEIANQDLPTAQAALATLDPSSSFGIAQSVINSNFRLNRLAQNHLAAVRGSARTHRQVGSYADDAKCSMPSPDSSTVTGRGNVWGTVSYDNQDFEGNTNQADFEGDTGSFTAGVDWLVAPQLILGLVFDGSRSNLDGQNADSTDVDSFRAAAYGTWGAAMGLYSDFMVGVGDHDLENTKSFTLLGNLSSDTDATSVQAIWTIGYTMGNDQVKHGPFAGFEYQRLDVDGYSQGGIVPIAVGDYDIDSLRALLGYRVDATYGNFNPYAAVAYSHEFQNGSNKANATVGGQPFTVVGAEQSSAFLVSIGTGYALTDALTLDFGYRGELATDDGITSHGASLGLNYAF